MPSQQRTRRMRPARWCLLAFVCVSSLNCMSRALRSYRLGLSRTERDVGVLRTLGAEVPARFLVKCHGYPDFVLDPNQCEPAKTDDVRSAEFREQFLSAAQESLRLQHGEPAVERREKLLRESRLWIYDESVQFDAPLVPSSSWVGYLCVAFIVQEPDRVLSGFVLFHEDRLAKLLKRPRTFKPSTGERAE